MDMAKHIQFLNMPQENNIYFKILPRVLYVNKKIYENKYNKNNLTHSAATTKPKGKPYGMDSMSAKTNTRYGSISF